MSIPELLMCESATEPVVVVGKNGVIIFANRHVEKLLDYAPGALDGLPVEALVPERYRNRHVDLRKMFQVDPLMRRMGPGREIVAVSREGREIPVEIGLIPATNGDHVLTIIRDISTTVHARRQLESSALRLQTIAMCSADIVTETNIETGAIIWHGDVDTPLGYEPGEFPRDREAWLENIHPDDAEEVRRLVEQATLSGSFQADYRIRCKDGRYRHWESHCQVIEKPEGWPPTLVGSIRDVTERVLANERLEVLLAEAEASAALNQTILNSLLAHIAILDGDGKIIAVNEGWSKFAHEKGGFSHQRAGVGANYLDDCRQANGQDADAARALAGVAAVLDGSRESFTMEYPCHDQSEQRWFWLVATPARAATGGAVVVHVPATERVLARQELERTVQEVARMKRQLEVEHAYLQEEIKVSHNFEEIIGESAPMRSMFEAVALVAETEATVLLLGETGTG